MRITQKQYDRLHAAREADHISIQEHVRRALDYYLDGLDRKGRQMASYDPPPKQAEDMPPHPAPMAPASSDAGSISKRKLVYR